jgi:hypothetical protein
VDVQLRVRIVQPLTTLYNNKLQLHTHITQDLARLGCIAQPACFEHSQRISPSLLCNSMEHSNVQSSHLLRRIPSTAYSIPQALPAVSFATHEACASHHLSHAPVYISTTQQLWAGQSTPSGPSTCPWDSLPCLFMEVRHPAASTMVTSHCLCASFSCCCCCCCHSIIACDEGSSGWLIRIPAVCKACCYD